MNTNVAYIQVSKRRWLRYSDPVDIIQTTDVGEVCSAFSRTAKAVEGGLYAAGYISYEASPAFDSSLAVHSASNLPLLWFGLYEEPEELTEPPAGNLDYSTSQWRSELSENDYLSAVERIKEYIKSGDTYQVNFTQRLKTDFSGDAYSYFDALRKSQQGRNCAFIDIGSHAICSASPELFLAVDGKSLKSCPMKGTAPRGLTLNDDREAADHLRNSEKNRAENVMIVDMIRNDMGRVTDTGTVKVESSFDIEKYPTVLQMTSTVRSESSESITDIMKAMFPCSSITGAPKVRTMEIIKELESGPRGVYTGSIGCMAPGRKALFNVAIRTVLIDKRNDVAEYGVGGGIVWDSEGQNEYSECLDKARVLTVNIPQFKLLETLLWNGDAGYLLIDEHIARLSSSAEYFGMLIDVDLIREKLNQFGEDLHAAKSRVRLLVDSEGEVELESTKIASATKDQVFQLRIASAAIDSGDRFLYHKTTNRGVYERAKRSCPKCDDVILHNQLGEVTETTIANIVLIRDGLKITPPVKCGLLPGTMRAHLLETGEIEEGIITLSDLEQAEQLFIINSVRGWVKASLTITP